MLWKKGDLLQSSGAFSTVTPFVEANKTPKNGYGSRLESLQEARAHALRSSLRQLHCKKAHSDGAEPLHLPACIASARERVAGGRKTGCNRIILYPRKRETAEASWIPEVRVIQQEFWDLHAAKSMASASRVPDVFSRHFIQRRRGASVYRKVTCG